MTPKDSLVTKNQVALQRVTWCLFSLHFCFELEIHPSDFGGVTFHKENVPESGNVIVWKVEGAFKDCCSLDNSSG